MNSPLIYDDLARGPVIPGDGAYPENSEAVRQRSGNECADGDTGDTRRKHRSQRATAELPGMAQRQRDIGDAEIIDAVEVTTVIHAPSFGS